MAQASGLPSMLIASVSRVSLTTERSTSPRLLFVLMLGPTHLRSTTTRIIRQPVDARPNLSMPGPAYRCLVQPVDAWSSLSVRCPTCRCLVQSVNSGPTCYRLAQLLCSAQSLNALLNRSPIPSSCCTDTPLALTSNRGQHK